jgi:hypothetical protein
MTRPKTSKPASVLQKAKVMSLTTPLDQMAKAVGSKIELITPARGRRIAAEGSPYRSPCERSPWLAVVTHWLHSAKQAGRFEHQHASA